MGGRKEGESLFLYASDNDNHVFLPRSVFVLKRKLFSSSTSNQLEIHRVFSVYGDFNITMAQLPQDLNDPQVTNLPRSRASL